MWWINCVYSAASGHISYSNIVFHKSKWRKYLQLNDKILRSCIKTVVDMIDEMMSIGGTQDNVIDELQL